MATFRRQNSRRALFEPRMKAVTNMSLISNLARHHRASVYEAGNSVALDDAIDPRSSCPAVSTVVDDRVRKRAVLAEPCARARR